MGSELVDAIQRENESKVLDLLSMPIRPEILNGRFDQGANVLHLAIGRRPSLC